MKLNPSGMGKKLRLVPIVGVLCGLAAIQSGTAFATSASISPGTGTYCGDAYIYFTLRWSGNPPSDVHFDDGDGGWFWDYRTYDTVDYWDHDYGISARTTHLDVYDYGCGNSCGIAHTTTRVVVYDYGVGGCPLGPTP